MAELQLPTGETALIDDADAGWASELIWRRHTGKAGKQYVGAQVLIDGKRKLLLLHRMVLGLTDRAVLVDHRNGNGFDDRRTNLRHCTHGQNIMNQIRKQRSKTSKYKGVMWSTRHEKWEGQIKADKKKYYLGRFNNEDSAARAYNEAAVRLHGDFACLNFVN